MVVKIKKISKITKFSLRNEYISHITEEKLLEIKRKANKIISSENNVQNKKNNYIQH